MNPWQLAKESEESQQMALFCFLNKAERVGFYWAMHKSSYEANFAQIYKIQLNADFNTPVSFPVPALKWLHAINNGVRSGDARSRIIEGGKLKAAGVKAGILDLFWPLPAGIYCGLYIEMKKSALKSGKDPLNGCSDEQKEFGGFVSDNGYFAKVCYSWLEAAETIQKYYELRKE